MDPNQPLTNPTQEPLQPVSGAEPQQTQSTRFIPDQPGSTTESQPTVPVIPPFQAPIQSTPLQTMPAQESSQQNSSANYLPTSSSNKKPMMIVVAVVLFIVLALGGGALLIMSKNDGSPLSNLANNIKGTDDVVSRKDGTLDLSSLIDKQESIKAQDLKAKLNQQVNLSDGTSYMVTSVERNFTSTSRYLVAGTGKELIRINIVVGNKSKEGNSYITSSFFKIKNSAGGLQDSEYVTADELPEALESQEVAPGKQVSGAIIFEVDKDEIIEAVATSDDYQNYSTNEEITIKSEVALQ